MPHEFFDPTPEQQVVVLVDAETLHQAERLIESCEGCNEEGAEIPFETSLIERGRWFESSRGHFNKSFRRRSSKRHSSPTKTCSERLSVLSHLHA